jgi:hypothetical protein
VTRRRKRNKLGRRDSRRGTHVPTHGRAAELFQQQQADRALGYGSPTPAGAYVGKRKPRKSA